MDDSRYPRRLLALLLVSLGAWCGCSGGRDGEPGRADATPHFERPAATGAEPADELAEEPAPAAAAMPEAANPADGAMVRSLAPPPELAMEAEAPMPPSPAPPPVEKTATRLLDGPENAVVKVFYATDRAAVDVASWSAERRAGWPVAAASCAVAAAILSGFAAWRRGRLLRVTAFLALSAAVTVTALTVYVRWAPPVGTTAIATMYGPDRGELAFGTCDVSIPRKHEVGSLESPSIFRLELRQSPERHVMLVGLTPCKADQFFHQLGNRVAQSPNREAFVFVHGYNVGFETAARRTAQIAYDLKFAGAPILYSWPSQAQLMAYAIDETNVAWTVPHLKEFLVDVAEKSAATNVHLIAHSMGNRALTSALRELQLELDDACPKFRQVVLTAPDIDADVFRRDLAPAIARTASRVTLYASSNDEALIASKRFHGYPRAGESGQQVTVVEGIDTVDVSDVDTSLVGHSYYGSNDTVLADLCEVIQAARPPQERRWLRAAQMGLLTYWQFFRAAGGDASTARLGAAGAY